MKRRISVKRRRLGSGKGKQKNEARSQFAPRPFPADVNGTPLAVDQAQQERIARSSPGLVDIPLYPSTTDAATTVAGAGAIQMQPDEANLKPPRGTLQRQQVDEKQQKEELNLMPQSATPKVDEKEEAAVQTKEEADTLAAIEDKEAEEQEQLQAKAEAEEVEEEADEEIQEKEEEKEDLKAKLEPEKEEELA